MYKLINNRHKNNSGIFIFYVVMKMNNKHIEIYENEKKINNGRNIPTVGYSVGPMSICR